MGIFGLGKPNVERMKKKKDLVGLKKAFEEELPGSAEALLHVAEELKDVDSLILLLNCEFNTYKWKAAYALGQIKDPRAVEPLVDVLFRAPSTELANQASSALKKLNAPGTAGLFAGRWGTDEATWEIIGLLKELKDPKGLPKLLDILSDRSPYNREKAAQAMGEFGDESCLEKLSWTMEHDSEWSVRYAAEEAYNSIKNRLS